MTSYKFQIGDKICTGSLIGTVVEITKKERYTIKWIDGTKDAYWSGLIFHLFQNGVDKLDDIL